MTVFELLQTMHSKKIKVSVHDEKLKVDAPPGAMTVEILELLKASKQELINYLTDSAAKESMIEIIDRKQALELSFAQQRLWFIDQMDGGSPHYNMHSAMMVRGDFNLAAAQVAFVQIIERHEPLRTVFNDTDSGPVQVIHQNFDFKITQVDLTHITNSTDLEHAIDQAIEQHSKHLFDLAHDLMLKVSFLKTAEKEGCLLFNMHHIASDGWSTVVLVKEFTEFYKSSLNNSTNPLKSLDIQYADFAHWQRKWLQGDVLDRQLQYWANQLAGLPQAHNLSLDFERPLIQTFAGARHQFVINESTLKSLKSIALQNHATLFMVLHTAFSVLLSRYSDTNDIVVGTPVANRRQKELEPLIGVFVNTLVLRTDCSNNPPFIELLKQVKNTNLEAQANQDLPFEYLVDKLKPNRSTSHTALFQILLNMDTNEAFELNLPNVTLKPRKSTTISTKFDLVLSIHEEQGLGGSFEYNTELFSSHSIKQMTDSFALILNAIATDPTRPIAELPILTHEQIKYQLETLNQTDIPYPKDLCVHQLFEKQVEITPDKNAVFFSGHSLSYSELNIQANQLAHYLIEQGVKQGEVVGLCLERSLDMLVSLTAVLKVGAAYLPVDPSNPSGRLEYIFRDSRMDRVLTQHHLTDRFAATNQLIVDDIKLIKTLSAYPQHNPKIEKLNSSHLAYVIYTSGSTGMPKGVMIEHHSVINLANNIKNLEIDDSNKSWGWIAPLAFDSSVKGICMLLHGKPLHIISDEDKKNVNAMKQLLLAETIGVLDCTPTLLEFWLSSGLEELLPNLIIGGEAVSLSLWERLVNWQDKYDKKAINVYGPTECCVDSSATTIAGKKPNIGQALNNYQFYILDKNKAILPVGNIGELYIAGSGLARGYLNPEQSDSERFMYHSFNDETPIRLYKTGDLVRYLADGHLEFIARTDEQVKIHGYRIELGEIQHHIETCQGVLSSVVLIYGDKDTARLVTYFTIEASTEKIKVVEHIRQVLQKYLPDYMIPSVFIVLDKLPINSNGKIDRNALPDPVILDDVYVAPVGAIEKALSKVWAELLKCPQEKISAHADFFEMGGHSLLTIRLIAEIRSEFNSELSVRAVFEKPKLSEMAGLISKSTSRRRPKIIKSQRMDDLVLPSYAQQRLWFIDQMDEGSTHYNMPSALRVDGQFEVAKAQEAFTQIIQRHESLRTVFIEGEEGPLQLIRVAFEFKINQIDLTHLGTKKQNLAIDLGIKNEAEKAFNLSEDLMLRASFLNLGSDQGILLFNMHHIASDGWSMGLLVKEFMQFYQTSSNNKVNSLKALEIQYADYAHWQRHWLKDQVLDDQLNYWQDQLAELPQVHSLQLDFKRPQFQTFNGAWHHFSIDADVVVSLKSIALNNQATLFMVIHAVFSILLSRYSNSFDVLIGTPVANRLQKELESLIGFFVNTLVLRADCSNNPTFENFLAQIKNTHLSAQANQDIPFEYLVDQLNPKRNTSHNALFQIMLSMDTNEVSEFSLPDIKLTSYPSHKVNSKFDLSLFVVDGENFEFIFEYNTDLFNAGSIQRLADSLVELFKGVAKNPTQPINRLPLLAEQETQYLLRQLNDTYAEYPREFCIHELFEQQVTRTPENTAVVFEQQFLTYRELNQQANKLAHYLVLRGVKPDQFVGLCVDRSLSMMVGVIAILKAGAGYLPLDPSYPQDRLQHMLNDSQVELLLTQTHVLEELIFEQQEIICIDQTEQFEQFAPTNIDKHEINLNVQNLAYIVYTSGSTGKPKGAAVEHQNETNLLYWYLRKYTLNSSDKVLIMSAIGFDLTQKNLFAPLCCGASVQFATARYFDVNLICDFIRKNQITFTNCAPSAFYPLVENQTNLEMLSSFRCVLFGGESIAFDRLNIWLKQVPDELELINMYGPTECTDISCAYRIPVKDEPTAAPIGTANDNVQLFVLNEHQQLSPLGVPGELCVSGLGVSRGYLNQPVLTAEKFILNPFSVGSEKIYRTGDLVKWNKNLQLEFIGRIDNQIKIRGFRVELGEIESTINKQASISQSVVIYNDTKYSLSAYLVANKNQAPDIEKLRKQLQRMLPDYMVPNGYAVIDVLPLTTHGKIDKKALSLIPVIEIKSEFVKPKGSTEKELVKIWSTLLELSDSGISTDGNFFELGGHSLLLTKMLHLIVENLETQLAVKDIFNAPTIADIAALIDVQSPATNRLITKQEKQGPSVLSYGQYRIWFIEQLRDQSNEHNISVGVKIKGTFKPKVFEQALNHMILMHEILRTKIITEDNIPKQLVEPVLVYQVEVKDLSRLIGAEKDVEISRLTHQQDTQNFDLHKLPLFAVLLLKTAADEFVLHFNQHHIISDGWSQQLFYGQLMLIYQKINTQQNWSAEPPTLSYTDYAAWQQKWLSSNEATEQRDFWKRYLHQCNEKLILPIENHEGKLQAQQSLVQQHLTPDLRDKMVTMARANKGSLFNVLHAGFALLLARLSGQADFNLGVPVTGRHIYGTQNMLGMFLNTLPVRHKLDLKSSFNVLLQAQILNIEKVLSNQDLPLEQIFETVECERVAESTPLFQILFNMLSIPGEEFNDDFDFGMEVQETAEIENKFNITVYLRDSESGVDIFCHYNSSVFSKHHIEQLFSQYKLLLSQIVNEPQLRCEAYCLNEGTSQINYAEVKNTASDTNLNLSDVTALFRSHVALTPDAIAIKDEFNHWSYSDLLVYSNGLATELKSQGVKRTDVVTIMASRQANLVGAVLATLQLGAAYSIVTPETPISRVVQHLTIVKNTVTLLCESSDYYKSKLIEAISKETTVIHLANQPNYYATVATRFVPATDLLDSVACITFTSGSSGVPKAVEGTHLGLCGYLNWLPEATNMTPLDQFGMLSGLAHDPLQRDIFGAICNGATLVIPSKQQFSSYQFNDWIKQNNISVLHLTPAMAEIIGMKSPFGLDSLRLVFLTGEALRRDIAKSMLELNGVIKIYNCYGATETQRAATYHQVLDINSEESVIPIAMSTPDTSIKLINNNGQNCGLGEIGMICTDSMRIAKGYLNDEGLTQSCFIHLENGLRRYITGDLGVCLDGCTIKYLGRQDSQINIRGFRIELGEIEYQLSLHSKVQSCAAVVYKNESIVAYVTTADSTQNESELVNSCMLFLKGQLPDYMLPSAVVVLDQMPLTANRKIDRKSLPTADLLMLRNKYLAPKTSTEIKLTEMWSVLLKLPTLKISIDANFFELGGHSLLLLRLLTEIHNSFAVDISLKYLFELSDLASLANFIDSLKEQSNISDVLANTTDDDLEEVEF